MADSARKQFPPICRRAWCIKSNPKVEKKGERVRGEDGKCEREPGGEWRLQETSSRRNGEWVGFFAGRRGQETRRCSEQQQQQQSK